ncbi:hypothetical protein Adt_04819 [Abeliophyllum distichum]|uniref:Uncharacterized protein n=1 Tax=Abeliophyllum distichum TaxID=126358 RepID=A0ABD1V4E8_9LAMI
MSSEVGSDSGREGLSWDRGHEEQVSLDRMVEGIDEDEVLSPTPLTTVPPLDRSSPQAEMSGERRGQLQGFRPSSKGDDTEFFVLGPNDRADDPPLGCVALNQVVLATGLRLSFPRIVGKFLRYTSQEPTEKSSERTRRARAPRPRQTLEPIPQRVPSSARSVEEITSFRLVGGLHQANLLDLHHHPTRYHLHLQLCRSIPKPARDFFRSNSPPRDEIAALHPYCEEENPRLPLRAGLQSNRDTLRAWERWSPS